jgi:PAS domain S-box-containing protein
LRFTIRHLNNALEYARSNERALIESNRELRAEITERERAEEALRESEAELAAVFDGVGDGIALIDRTGRVVRVNRRIVEVGGYTEEEIIGKRFEFLNMFPPHSFKKIVSRFATLISGQQVPPFEVEVYTKAGRKLDIELRGSLLRRGGKAVGIVGVMRDITERKQAEEALRQYTAELEARNEELDAFAHTVAHDLKNPLGLVVGHAETLEADYDTLPSEALQVHVRAIARNTRRVSRIIDELLLLSGLRQMEVEMMPLDMASIVAEARQRLAYMIEGQQAEIVLPETWPVALGYGPWIEEVWINYLDNAIKYGGRPPRVELGAAAQPEGMVRFWIRDNGPGLKPEEQARLFTPFTRLDQVHARGHGLGLSIVRRIVEKLGGQVEVESEVGQGSTFAFTLPGMTGGK